MAVHLSAISTYYLALKGPNQPESQLAFAYTGRTNYSYQAIHLIF